MKWLRVFVAVLLMVLGLLLISHAWPTTSSLPSKTLPTKVPADFFATPSRLADSSPGEILKKMEIAPNGDARTFAIMYRSVSPAGDPIPVTAVVSIPNGEAPRGGWPVLAWAHGLYGIGDDCAPSRVIGFNATAVPGDALRKGFIVVATDYEGLGTQGIHPFLIGVSEGRSVLDSIRAVQKTPEFTASDTSVIWGQSQGGHAALFAASLAPTYAPELKVSGVVAAAPATNPAKLFEVVEKDQKYRYFLLYGLASYLDAYKNLKSEDVLNGPMPAEREIECLPLVGYPPPGDFALKADPTKLADWREALDQNAAPTTKYSTPVLVVQGSADTLVPQQITDDFVARACKSGNAMTYMVVPGAGHVGELFATGDRAMRWTRGVAMGVQASMDTSVKGCS